MNYRFVLVGLLLLLFVGFDLSSPVAAQDAAPITVAEFWSRMATTEDRLTHELDFITVRRISRELLLLWPDVQPVTDGDQTLYLDLQWLTQPLRTQNLDRVQPLIYPIRGLLQYQAAIGGASSLMSLSELQEVLRDPRFQYQEPTPTAPNLPNVSLPNGDLLRTALQILLVVIVVGVILVVGISLYNSFNTRALKLRQANALTDEPATESAAVERADQSAAIADYRAAVRYLYLAALLKLDEQRLLRYDSSLTNREHVDQVSNNTVLQNRLRQVVNIFDDVWYGNQAVDQSFYEDYRAKVQHLWQPS